MYTFAQGMVFITHFFYLHSDMSLSIRDATENRFEAVLGFVLLRRPEDLAVFKAAFSISPIILPFNASSPAIRNLYVSSPSNSFRLRYRVFPDLSAPLSSD